MRALGSTLLRGAATAALVRAAAPVGCGVTDEVVAELACRTSTDCGGGSFCSMTSCSDTLGTCRPTPDPATCEMAGLSPVCGCQTGLLYFNDCLRQERGVDFAAGPVGGDDSGAPACKQVPCTASGDGGAQGCPAGASCLRAFDQECQHPLGPGTCVVLPLTCPEQAPSQLFPGSPQVVDCDTNQCSSYCSAVMANDRVSLALGPDRCP